MTLDKLTIDQLHGSQLEIAEVIGIEAYRKLVASYGGSSIYISKADSVMNRLRDTEIYSKFDGTNYLELAHMYNLAENTIRDIIYRQSSGHEACQMTLFDP